MAVNEEVPNLERLLEQSPKFLKTNGRLAVISFHSVEDRLVKQAFRSAEQTGLLKSSYEKAPLSRSRRTRPQSPIPIRQAGAPLRNVVESEGAVMTRETKIGLLVGLAFIIVIGIMLSDLNSTNNQKLPAPLQMAGSTLRTGLGQPVTDDVSPITVVPQNITPHPINIAPPEQPLALKPEAASQCAIEPRQCCQTAW